MDTNNSISDSFFFLLLCYIPLLNNFSKRVQSFLKLNMNCTSAAFMQDYYGTLMSWLEIEVRVHTVHTCTFCTTVLLTTTIPDLSQSRAQKNFFSLKGFSEVGTGVISGSSQACASQYAIRSAAAFETCRRRKSSHYFKLFVHVTCSHIFLKCLYIYVYTHFFYKITFQHLTKNDNNYLI